MSKLSELSKLSQKSVKAANVKAANAGLASRVHDVVMSVLGETQALITETGMGIESLATPVRRNKNFDVEANFPVNKLVQKLQTLEGMPESKIESITTDVLRVLDGQCAPGDVVRDMPSGTSYGPLSGLVGTTAAGNVVNNDIGVEAWGEDINLVASDERVTLEMLIMRPFNSTEDKIWARVPTDSNIITVQVPNPSVYNWLKTQSGLSIDRNENNNTQLRDLYRDPSTVNSAPQPMIPQKAADTNNVLWNGTTFLKVGLRTNMMDLCMISNTFGYDHADRSDLICEGGKIRNVVIALTDGTTTEFFQTETNAFKRAALVPNPNSRDSGDRQAIMPFYAMITAGDLMSNGTASTLAATFTDSTVQVRVDLTVTLSLKYGDITSSATTQLDLVSNTANGAPSDAETTAANKLTATVVAIDPALYFDEENYRKSNLAIWVNYNQNQFAMPRARNYFTEYQLNQQIDVNAVQATSSIMSLGNSYRSLGIIVDALNDVATAATYANRNAATAKYNQLDESSMVSSLVKPQVYTTTIDFGDEEVAVMNESTRPYEMQGRARSRILSMVAELYAKTLMINQYNAGEQVVLKAVAYSSIADVLLGITDYRPDAATKVATAAGADFSLLLPNGYRLDVVKTTFDCMVNRIVILPSREGNGADLTNTGHILDRGTASAIYAPTNYGATVRRVVSTCREILMVTNPIGLMIQIANIDKMLGSFDTTPMALAPTSNNFSALTGTNG